MENGLQPPKKPIKPSLLLSSLSIRVECFFILYPEMSSNSPSVTMPNVHRLHLQWVTQNDGFPCAAVMVISSGEKNCWAQRWMS